MYIYEFKLFIDLVQGFVTSMAAVLYNSGAKKGKEWLVQAILNSVYVDAARRELESVAASLARTPRLEQLLRYMAQRYFDGLTNELTEYNIATEVFGRKKTEFIAGEDAIARVETHRLRKRLTAYYEGPGRDHAIQISIPLGGYVPHFTDYGDSIDAASTDVSIDLIELELPSVTVEEMSQHHVSRMGAVTSDKDQRGPEADKGEATVSRRWRWMPAITAMFLFVMAVAGLVVLRSRTSRKLTPTPVAERVGPENAGVTDLAKPGATNMRTVSGMIPVAVPFRVIAGYSGAPQRDNAGDIWQGDQYSNGGWARHQSKAFIARTGNPFLFRYGRAGDFSYNIPLPPGSYELHLYFMQGSDTGQSEDAENKAIFTVLVNDNVILRNFDIVSDALGRNIADERVFRDVSPASDGMLHIHLSTVLGTPSLCAIQILPDSTHTQLPLRLVMQPTSYTDRHGQLWRPDDYYLSGRSLSHDLPEASTDADVLPFERYGHFQYALPVDTRDHYTLTLRFAELYFGTPDADNNEERRLFRVLCNGETLLDSFDINKEVGNFHMLEKTFYHLKPSAQGKLNLDFEPISNYATVSSIEVFDESR